MNIDSSVLTFNWTKVEKDYLNSKDRTPRHNEGLFFGIQGFILKMAFLISIALLPILLVSGSGLSFIDMLTSVPKGPDPIGIYRTAAASAFFFIVAFVFYFFFPEEIVKDD